MEPQASQATPDRGQNGPDISPRRKSQRSSIAATIENFSPVW